MSKQQAPKRSYALDIVSFGVALVVTIGCAYLFTAVTPLPHPLLSILLAFACGGLVYYAVSKAIDPRDANQKAYDSEVDRLVAYGKAAIATSLVVERVSARKSLEGTARLVGTLVKRFRSSEDTEGLTAAMILMSRFCDETLDTHEKIIRRDIILPEKARAERIQKTEMVTIPAMEQIMTNLGEKITRGELRMTDIAQGTLETMARSLGLLNGLSLEEDEEKEK